MTFFRKVRTDPGRVTGMAGRVSAMRRLRLTRSHREMTLPAGARTDRPKVSLSLAPPTGTEWTELLSKITRTLV
jgi:hypothetical protein